MAFCIVAGFPFLYGAIERWKFLYCHTGEERVWCAFWSAVAGVTIGWCFDLYTRVSDPGNRRTLLLTGFIFGVMAILWLAITF
jgi:hypothetical protein